MSRDDRSRGAALAALLLIGVPALDLLVGASPAAVHAVVAACGIAFFVVWLAEL